MAIKDQPISEIQWIPIEKVHANDYNPNSVATPEMKLLYISVKQDGYTQPVVTIYDEKKDRYVIVDGFHRYSIMRRYKDIYASCEGKLPCGVAWQDDERPYGVHSQTQQSKRKAQRSGYGKHRYGDAYERCE